MSAAILVIKKMFLYVFSLIFLGILAAQGFKLMTESNTIAVIFGVGFLLTSIAGFVLLVVREGKYYHQKFNQ